MILTNRRLQCCDPNTKQSWGILNALVGWTNSATYGTVISYNVYWIFVMCMFGLLRYKEAKGHWLFMKPKVAEPDSESISESGRDGIFGRGKSRASEKAL
jgi:high-affinity iron transporter